MSSAGGAATSTSAGAPVSTLARATGVTTLVLPVLAAFSVPVLGFVVSLLLPLFAAWVRRRLWPRTRPYAVHVCSALVLTGLWLPALLALLSQGRVALPGSSTISLVIPLCGPADLAGFLLPALGATAAYLAGSVVSALVRHPWPWVLGAWAAPLAYAAASRWLTESAVTC